MTSSPRSAAGSRPSSAPPGGSDVARGIAWMLAATLCFVMMDAVAKHLTESYHVVEVVWGRFAMHVLWMVLILRGRLPALAVTRSPGRQLLRSGTLCAITLLIFTSLALMPLADFYAIFQLTPIATTALSVPLLGERVGLRRWLGVAAGFAGALIIVRPGFGAFGPEIALPLIVVAIYGFFGILTRRLSFTDRPMTTAIYTPLVGLLVTSLLLPFVWRMPSALDWALMAAQGGVGFFSQYALIRAYTAAPASVVAPFSYASLVWALVFGFAVFGDLPDGATLAGAFVIVASGLYIWSRERQAHRRPPDGFPPPA